MADSKSDKVKDLGKSRWLWLTIVASVAIVVLWMKSDAISGWWDSKFAQKPSFSGTTGVSRVAGIENMPASKEPPLRFIDSKQVKFAIRTNEWSRQVVLPVHPTKAVDCRIELAGPTTGYHIQFQDGHIESVLAGRGYPDFGVRRGIFRMMGTSDGQEVTVTISFRSE